MNKKISTFLAALLLGTLTACAQYKTDQQLVAEPDPVALRLSSAVDKASAALQTLASVEQARNPGVNLQMPPSAPVELRRIVSVDWTGPIEPIARSLADRAGYQMQVNGDRPPVPVVVSLVAREKSVVEVLRDIGLQAGQRADVVVDPDRRLVELNYAAVSGG
jgi:defect-in-organelle-trafficking protein DotD